MAREYFTAYHSYLDAMEELKDAERGRLFTACLLYSKTGEVMELSGNERFIFPLMRGQIDRDRAGYEAKCAKNRENGAKANATERHRTLPNAPQGKGEGKGEDNIPPISPKGEANAFEVFWEAYPRKEGMDAARRAFERIKDVPVDVMVAAINEQKKTAQWKEENGKYIPSPKKWLSEGHWKNTTAAAKIYGDLMKNGIRWSKCES